MENLPSLLLRLQDITQPEAPGSLHVVVSSVSIPVLCHGI